MGEHIIQCDDPRFIPLARSRIAAIRASGLRFGSQRFTVDGVTITVQLKGDQEYVGVEGGVDVLSGIVRDGVVVETPAPEGSPPGTAPTVGLSSFKPTPQAYAEVLHEKVGAPNTFLDIPQLAVGDGAQYRDISASSYSGKMAKVVQVLLGTGRKNATRYPLTYKSKWSDCHGIAEGADGKLWLVHISATVGVRIMKLPLSGGAVGTRQDVLRVAKDEFGGLPTGRDFPTGVKLASKVERGDILVLIPPEGMAGYFANNPYSDDVGWSFNEAGSKLQFVQLQCISVKQIE